MENSDVTNQRLQNSKIDSPASGANKGDSNFAIQAPTITLPKGGGALKNIDEKFNVNAANGTASCSVALPFSTTRSHFIPAMSLNYNSGSGNSEFGLGWSVDCSSIQRKTDKRLPEYKDDRESDVFMFSGVEDLVPLFQNDGAGNWQVDETTDAISGYKIKRY